MLKFSNLVEEKKMNLATEIAYRLFMSIMLIFLFCTVTYVPEDEMKNIKITPGDQLIIDLFKEKW